MHLAKDEGTRRRTALCSALAAALLSAGCGAAVPEEEAPVSRLAAEMKEPVRLDPIHVRATEKDGEYAIEVYDAATLFDEAAAKLRKGRCEEAVELYGRIVDEFGETRFLSASLYNSGLCSEQLERFEDAAQSYRALIERVPDSPDVKDALFRLAGAYEELEAWKDAVASLDALLHERDDVAGIERVEALARKGSALIETGDLEDASLVLGEAVRLHRSGRGIEKTDPVFHVGMAQFRLGEILHERMRDVDLPADEAAVEAELERKCQLLLDAQAQYTKAIKVLHPHWAAAAAYRIGDLYRDLWDDIVAAPPPEDLNAEEREVYLDVLRGRIRVLLEKAVLQWERTLKLGIRLEMSNEWIDNAIADLEEVREILVVEEAGETPDAGTPEGGETP